ncbi:MAG: chorismate mutase [Clostridia bacterium]|nr:chorismate mutase [Clostridia bacterium]
MDINELREKIDGIDAELCALIEKRMNVAAEIGKYKKENGLPVHDPRRERQKLVEIAGNADPELRRYMTVLYSLIFEISRSRQQSIVTEDPPIVAEIADAIENTPKLFPETAAVACQGVEGAYSQIACDKMFKTPSIVYFKNFDGVFSAVSKGLCKYGVLPLENTVAGSVKKVYDLMISNDFRIVRSTDVRIEHCLLVPRGVALSDIKEVFSHEQAISQCSEFLRSLGDGVTVTRCSNTAAAAEEVASSGRRDAAAIASFACSEIYGLDCLSRGIEDSDNNHTKFVTISKSLEIYPGADRTSLMMVLPHKPGSLYKALSRFYALGINLLKLESRPIPGRDFEFSFYFDLETSVYSDEFVKLMRELYDCSEQFKYLGSYSEVR